MMRGAHYLHASVAGPVRHLAQEGSGVVVGVVARERYAAAIKEAALSALRLGAEGVKVRLARLSLDRRGAAGHVLVAARVALLNRQRCISLCSKRKTFFWVRGYNS